MTRSPSTDPFPDGYIRFERFRNAVSAPSLIQVSETVSLETLHLSGPTPALVFVHGGLGSLWNPYPQLHAFRGERELVTYSLAGNGQSSPPPEQSVDGHVANLRALLDELGVEKPVVHGHSYGTAIAIEYAKRYPSSGLVLHAGGDHDLTPAWERPFMRLFLFLRLYRLPTHDAVMRRLAYHVGFHEETSRVVVEDFLQSNPMPERREAWETVTGAFWGYDGREDMYRIDVPTLVIHGPADGIVPLEVGRGTASRIGNSVFCRVERTGHIAMIERPAAYNRLLRSLFRTIESDGALDSAVREATESENGSP